MSRFEGKVALVTGGASGIGDAIVRGLLAEGARVAVLDVNADLLDKRRREFGPEFHAAVADVTAEPEVAGFVSGCIQRFGRLDLAFNVAGASKSELIVQHSGENWDFTVDLCLKGVFICVKHEAMAMLPLGGAIVNVSSVCAHLPVRGGASYCAAKAGVEMLTRVAALELARQGVRINTLLPGYTYTPGLVTTSSDPDLDQAIVERIPLQRAASPSEIAAPALFLASDAARYIVGASLVVDGGWELTGCPDFRSNGPSKSPS